MTYRCTFYTNIKPAHLYCLNRKIFVQLNSSTNTWSLIAIYRTQDVVKVKTICNYRKVADVPILQMGYCNFMTQNKLKAYLY